MSGLASFSFWNNSFGAHTLTSVNVFNKTVNLFALPSSIKSFTHLHSSIYDSLLQIDERMLFRGALNPRILSRMAPSHHIPKPCSVTEFRPVEAGGRIELIIGKVQPFYF